MTSQDGRFVISNLAALLFAQKIIKDPNFLHAKYLVQVGKNGGWKTLKGKDEFNAKKDDIVYIKYNNS